MKALTINAPWAWAIMRGYKRVENRTWATAHRGRLAIHAGRSKVDDAEALALFARVGIPAPSIDELDALRGRVLGSVELTEIVEHPSAGLFDSDLADDPFVEGPLCWLLADPEPLDAPPKIGGKLGLWDLPAELVRQ